MRSRKQQIRRQFHLESLEGRKAPSSLHGMEDHGAHREAEVERHGRGRDDGPGHDANDDRGAAHGRRGHDDPPGHDANEHRAPHR